MRRFLVAVAVLIAVISVAASGSGTQAPGAQESVRFYVVGLVKSPGSYEHQPGMTVLQGIALAGGLTERGSDRGIKIVRKVDGEFADLDVDLSFLVLPNDTIKVRQRLQ